MLLNVVTRHVFLIITVISCIVIRFVIDAADDKSGAVQSGFHAAVTAIYIILFPISEVTTTFVVEIVGLQVLQFVGLLVADQMFWDFIEFALLVFYSGLLVSQLIPK